jgi:tetratricopeptide (TPR) repeat protein
MRGPCFLAACAFAVFGVSASTQPTGRLLAAYTDAVHAYQRGDIVSASTALTRWSPRDLGEAGAALLRSRDWHLVEAAAMLHTDITAREILADPKTAVSHLALAEAFVRALPPSEASPFQPRWYAFAASIFLALTNPAGAQRLVDRGLALAPRDPQLHVVSGAIQEMFAHLESPECSGPGCDTRGGFGRARAMLGLAEAEYRRALDLDRQASEARLRLGRVLFLQNRRPQAREELAAVVQTSTNIQLLYLAHMFLGGIDDYESDFTHARLEYEAALKLEPGFQTPYIALSFAEQMVGESSQARQTARAMVALPKSTDADPWWPYQSGGLDYESLLWLRTRVQR